MGSSDGKAEEVFSRVQGGSRQDGGGFLPADRPCGPRDYREKHAGDEPPLDMPERARLRELERENRELKMKCEFLSKAAAYFAAEHR